MAKDPERYAFHRDNDLTMGTLQDYADIWERDVFAEGMKSVGLSKTVVSFDGDVTVSVHTVLIVRTDSMSHPDAKFTFKVGGERAYVLIPKNRL